MERRKGTGIEGLWKILCHVLAVIPEKNVISRSHRPLPLKITAWFLCI